MGASDGVIRYNPYKPTKKQRAWAAWGALIAVVAVVLASVVSGHTFNGFWFIAVFGLVAGALHAFATQVGLQIVVDPKEVRGPARVWLPWPRRVPWSHVRGVEYPGRHAHFVTLRLAKGETREFGLPAAYRQEVARIGSVALVDTHRSNSDE